MGDGEEIRKVSQLLFTDDIVLVTNRERKFGMLVEGFVVEGD